VLAQIVDVREDVFGAAVDLDAGNDRRHLRALLTGGSVARVAATRLVRMDWLDWEYG
jgi:hypothetical protein